LNDERDCHEKKDEHQETPARANSIRAHKGVLI
jgi:hypothetical protein